MWCRVTEGFHHGSLSDYNIIWQQKLKKDLTRVQTGLSTGGYSQPQYCSLIQIKKRLRTFKKVRFKAQQTTAA